MHGGYFKGRAGPCLALSAVIALVIAEGREGERCFGAFVIKGEIEKKFLKMKTRRH